jgi:hypothetical protein
MQRDATHCNASSIIPPHIHNQLRNLLRVNWLVLLPYNGDLALSFKQSQTTVKHVLSSEWPTEHSDVPGDKTVVVSIALLWTKGGDLHCAGAEHLDTQVPELYWVRLHGYGPARKWVRLGKVLGSGAEHGADLCCGRHCLMCSGCRGCRTVELRCRI